MHTYLRLVLSLPKNKQSIKEIRNACILAILLLQLLYISEIFFFSCSSPLSFRVFHCQLLEQYHIHVTLAMLLVQNIKFYVFFAH